MNGNEKKTTSVGKKRNIMTIVAFMLLSAALTYCITLSALESEYNAKLNGLLDMEEEYKLIDEVLTNIDDHFVKEYDVQDVFDGARYGMVASLGDRWSYYLTPEQFASVIDSSNSKMVGIGITAAYDEEKAEVVVLDVYEGSPAENAKIQPYDRIIMVDGNNVADIGYDAAVNKIRGDVDTAVAITIRREGVENPINLNITRREVDIQHVKSKILDGNIGYIKIGSFDANVDKDVAAAIENLKKAEVKGIIFDVRNNPGGRLNVLTNILDPLLPEGVIIKEVYKKGRETVHMSDAEELNMPMAVLANEYSISAAEFFAAALQESGKATVIGTPTTGKGVAQSHIPLSDGSGLVISVSRYYTGNGRNLDETHGILPDIEIKLTEEENKKFYLLSEAEDRQLQAAITEINRVNEAVAAPEAPSPDGENAPAEQTSTETNVSAANQ